jgi:hypothetical protein
MVPITGTNVRAQGTDIRREYPRLISKALLGELGESARAAKTIMQWTGASERAAKYWLAGDRGPSGYQLILLARNSDAVLHEFLRLSGRNLLKISLELDAAEAAIARAATILRALRVESG